MPYTKLVSEKVGECDGRPVIRLHEPLEWGNGIKRVVCPIGFENDGASIPKFAMAFLGYTAMEAGVIHDFLYREGAEITEGNVTREPTRLEADNIFLAVMKEMSISRIKRMLMWSAVRGFAGGNWHARKVMEPFIKQEVFV